MVPASVRFYTLIFSIVFGVPQVEWKLKYINYAKLKEYTKFI